MDLDKTEWKAVFKANGLLSGLAVNASPPISRVRRPAFVLSPDCSDEPDIPDFELQDNTSITVTELRSELQTSAVNHCLDWNEIESSLGRDLFTGSSQSSRLSGSSSGSSTQARDDIYVAYNFPRVVVYLRAEQLEVSAACRTALENLEKSQDIVSLGDFGETFGHIYSSVVHLGGRLECTRSMNSVAGSTMSEKCDSMRQAAGGVFSTARKRTVSPDWDRDRLTSEVSSMKIDRDDLGLAWEARGGDTLLSYDPSLWVPTVKRFSNWRVIKRSEVQPLHTLLAKIPEWVHLPDIFMSISMNHSMALKSPTFERQRFYVSSAVLRLLVRNSFDIDNDRSREMALLWASEQGNATAVAWLLRKGVSVECQGANRCTPLHRAVRANKPGVVTLLLATGAHLEHKNSDGYTPLMEACADGDTEIVAMLLDGGANMEAVSLMGWTPLMWAAGRQREAVVKLLIERGANLRHEGNGSTALMLAAGGGAIGIAQLLLDSKKVDANEKYRNRSDKQWASPLMQAARYGRTNMVELLLRNGADVDSATESRHETALDLAVKNGHHAVTDLLRVRTTKYAETAAP